MKTPRQFRRWLLTWGLLLLLGVISGCQNREPIQVGFVGGLTGRSAALGVDGRDGVLLAIDEINATGGIGGRRIELVVRDDLATPEGAVAADRELIEQGVVAIIGHMTSATMMGAWPLVEEAHVVFVSPTVSTPEIAGLDDLFFRLMPANSIQARQLAEYAAGELGIQKVVVFYDEDNLAYTLTYRDNFAEVFAQKGGQVLQDFPFSSAATPDFRPMLQQALALSPDTIFIVASALDTALILQQARLIGFDQQILISNWALTDDLIQNGGKAVEDVVAVTSHDENNQDPRSLTFREQFFDRFGRRPTFAAGYGYEAAWVLAEALKQTGGEADGLPEALLATQDFVGVQGTISMDAYGDVIRPVYIVTVEDGKFVTLAALGLPEKP